MCFQICPGAQTDFSGVKTLSEIMGYTVNFEPLEQKQSLENDEVALVKAISVGQIYR